MLSKVKNMQQKKQNHFFLLFLELKAHMEMQYLCPTS